MNVKSYSNPDLTVVSDNKPRWNTIEYRRRGFQNLHAINRYGILLRSDHVLDLTENIDKGIGRLPEVRALQAENKSFCGMVVAKGQEILHESYADDFHKDHPHSIQSITKTFASLIMGELAASNRIDLQRTVDDYLPEIGSGYAKARIQDVLDMNVANDYSEDYSDTHASSYGHEPTMGWRLPEAPDDHTTQCEFLSGIKSAGLKNDSGRVDYKSANTDVLGWIIERISNKPLRLWMLETVEAAGIENGFYCSTDRTGVPIINGGGSMTARDLARFGLLFARRGQGVKGRSVGDPGFIEHTAGRMSLMFAPPRDGIGYSNQMFSDGRWLGHGGYGGQFMLVDLKTGIVGVFFSVLENESGYDVDYSVRIVRMLESVVEYCQ